MLRIPGYQIDTRLFSGSRCCVYGAVRLADAQPVVLKTTRQQAAAADIQRFKRTYELTRDLAAAGICKTLDLFEFGRRPYLVLAPFAGRPLAELLASGPLEPGHALALGLRLVESLARLHELGLIHGDVNPSNVLVDEAGAVEIIDFDLARRVAPDTGELAPPDHIEGTLHYMAPEQTGRLYRPIDQRADLYGAGATLYEMLTGDPPFRAGRSAELIHSHLAVSPVAPSELRATIPEPASDLVLRLLAKEPDDRYQTAWGLAADLRLCVTQLETVGQIEPFELGAADISTRLNLDQHLLKRSDECETLRARLELATRGRSLLTLVRGPSGVGKSLMLQRLFAPQARRSARVVSGGFDVRDSASSTGLRQAVAELVDLVLSEPDDVLRATKAAALEALGEDASIVVDAMPSLRPLLDVAASAPELPPDETRHRFRLAFRHLLQSVATHERPLLLIIDDIHRADASDLELIAQLLTDPATSHLMVVAAYRDDVPDDGHIGAWTGGMESRGLDLLTVTLAPLSQAAVDSLMAAALAAPAAEIEPLAREVMAKTQGNPLFVARFIQSLRQDGTLRVDPARGRWTWNIERIRRLPYTENVAALMAQRVRLLPAATREVLAAAACLGVRFDPRLVAHALDLRPDDVLRHLWPALRDDLVEPPPNAAAEPPAPYRFVHDRIHASAYELIPPSDRAQVHLALGWALATDDLSDSGRAAATTQMGLGLHLIQSAARRMEVAAIALDAGRAVDASMAHSAARDLLAVGLQALPDDAWTTGYDTCLALHLARAANAESLSEFAVAAALLETALENATTTQARAEVRIRQIRLRSRASDPAGAIEAARACLDLFGEALPATPAEAVSMMTADDELLARQIHGRDLTTLAGAQSSADERTRLLLRAIAAAANPSYSQPWVLGALARKSVRISLERGHTPDSAHAFVLYGWMQAMVGDRASAEIFGRTGLSLAGSGAAAARNAPLHHLYATFIEHWLHPWGDSRARLERTLELARRQGNYDTGAWVALNLAWLAFAAEDDLMLAQRRIEELLAASRGEFEHADVARNIMLTMIRVRELTDDGSGPGYTLGEPMDEAELVASVSHFPGYLAATHVQRMIVRCLLGDLEQAHSDYARAAEVMGFAAASLWESRFHVYGALVLTGLWRHTPDHERAGRLEAIEASLARVIVYAEMRPEGFSAERDLILAELRAIRGEDDGVAALYDAAIRGAMEAGDRALTGLAAERCATWHERRADERMARSYLFDARYAFERWGALAKVARLDAHHALTTRRGSERLTLMGSDGTDLTGTSLELHVALMASRAVSGEIDLERLLATLMTHVLEVASATRGCLLLETDGRLLVEAAIDAPGEAPRVMMSRPITEHELCAAVVQSVRRSGQPVRLNDARASRRFARDPYIIQAQPRALLCMPIAHQGRVLALLYLENSVLSGAFDRGRHHALDLLGAQAAISIQNAFLYRREQKLAETLRVTATQLVQLQASHAQTESELRASKARLESQARSLEATVRQRTADIERMHRHHERVLRSIEQGILCVDPGGIVYFANPAAVRLGGWTADGLVGRAYQDLLVIDEAGRPDGPPGPSDSAAGSATTDARFLRASGEPLPVEMSIQPIRDDAGETMGAVVTFRDVTRRRELEAQLQQAQKMEAMGQFAGGVAHDFNNLLTPMLGNVALVRDVVGQKEPTVLPWLDDIERAGGRAAELVKQVLAFSRRSEVFLRPMDPVPLVDDIVRFLQRSVQPSISVIWERSDDLPWIQADAGGIHQVLLNLGLNARDALHERARAGGHGELRLTIRAEVERVDEAMAHSQPGLKVGHWVRLSVEDNGVGMAQSTRDRIFEPFFTTKEVGAGTGLGLSVVYGIVQQHGGYVVCTTREGHGTTMAFSLPARARGTVAPVETAAPVGRGRGERVLIADDEPLMRSLGQHVLENLGYRVVVVDDGLAAVAAYRAEPNAFALVILDISMPGLCGDEALRKILEIEADARVILWSGYSAMTEAGSAEELGARAFLPKPFRADELGRIVRRVLDS